MSRHIPRVYLDQPLSVGDELALSDAAAHHLVNVLRIRRGGQVCLFNGHGGEYLAEVLEAKRRSVQLRLTEFRDIDRESPLRILLAQGIARGERMDFAIAKAVEMGVHAVQPLHTRKSQRLPAERLARKLEHWRAVARSAAEQSGRTILPQVHTPQILGDWLDGEAQAYADNERLLLAPEATSTLQAASDHRQSCLLVGPESGLSDEEISQARAQGFSAIRLGPRVLRTETAGMAAITALQILWGDMG